MAIAPPKSPVKASNLNMINNPAISIKFEYEQEIYFQYSKGERSVYARVLGRGKEFLTKGKDNKQWEVGGI